MGSRPADGVAEVAVPCPDVEAAAGFLGELGFRVEAVSPADDPTAITVSGHGLRVRLERGPGAPPVLRLRLAGAERVERRGPGGLRVLIEPLDPPLALPPVAPSLQISAASGAGWVTGRAGMRYRDLIADRHGGRYIASHIHIREAGPVPDYVHYHRVDVQLIVCVGGWVRVVYQDQGPPFVLEPGDAILQAPGIRHRVLESSADLEVVELSSPAAHETRVDHELRLPNPARPGRRYGGQRFVHHHGAEGAWRPWSRPGFEARDLGVTEASGGRVEAAFVRRAGGDGPVDWSHGGALHLAFVIAGTAVLEAGDRRVELGRADAFSIPAGLDARLVDASGDLELLSIAAP